MTAVSLFVRRLSHDDGDGVKCRLMDREICLLGFAVTVQVLLATIALSSLIIKRHREYPRRPLIVWGFDTSKQALAAVCVHFVNVFIAALRGKESEREDNPCVWYFLNILLDTTVGVYILYLALKGLHWVVDYYQIPDMKSGEYGHPPRVSAWIRQFLLFIVAWSFVKSTVIFALDTFPILTTLASILLTPLEKSGDARLEVIVVMLIFPLIMNIIQAWLIDTVIKGKGGAGEYRYAGVGEVDPDDLTGDEESGGLFEGDDLIEDVEEHLGDFAVPRSSQEALLSGREKQGTGSGSRRPRKMSGVDEGRGSRRYDGSSAPLQHVHHDPLLHGLNGAGPLLEPGAGGVKTDVALGGGR
ncbi:hypothetical protein HK104_008344 [Borealophlyctis nickersoniae]|nr:hypothetical protein HK104_008344 [Borealophlyctis nickersoniae]